MYRPTPSNKNGDTTKYFLNEWPKFLRKYAVLPCEVVIVGDLNFHLDRKEKKQYNSTILLEEFGFHQHVQQPTHAKGHTLDLVTRKHSLNILDLVLVNNSAHNKMTIMQLPLDLQLRNHQDQKRISVSVGSIRLMMMHSSKT